MKKILTYFIKYRVAVNIIVLVFISFGIIGALSMKSSYQPLFDTRNISISVLYPGASPIEMEEGVVLKIENNLKGIVGIYKITSVSKENSAIINIEIERGKNIDVVLADVKNAVDKVPSFPIGIEPPIISKVENTRETISFTLSGENIPLTTLKQYAQEIEADLRNLKGISQITLSGFPEQEIEIALREKDLRAYNLSFETVANAIKQTNLLITGGSVKTDTEEYLIRANNRKYYADELHNLVIRADKSGNIIRLSDVADISDKWSETPDRIFYNGKIAANISISNTNNEDMLSSAEQVRTYIKKFNTQNDNLKIDITSDLSITLLQRTNLLLENIFYGVLLVLLFLALFLNVRLAFWVAAGLPIAFLGMFIFAAQLGVTINVFSLFGMIIVIGILVDDGIVIGENIYDHYKKGKSPVQAAIDGTMEVIPPILAAIATTIIAFSTFYFLDGRMGDMFSEVSTVVILTLLVSLIEALIILPAHIAHSKALADKKGHTKESKFDYYFKKINKHADKFLIYIRDRLYAPYLRFILKNKILGFAIPLSLLIISLGVLGGGIVKTSFFPSIASDRVVINLNMPQGTNESITDSIASIIEEAVWLVNDDFTKIQTGQYSVIENTIKRIGPGTSKAMLTVNMLPGENRDFSSQEITNAIRNKVGIVNGVESLTFGSGGNFGGSPVSVSLLGNNIQELKEAKKELKKQMMANPLLKDVADNDPAGIKEVNIKLKENGLLLGLNLQSVMMQVRSGFFGIQTQRLQRGQDEIKIWVRYNKEDRSSIKNLDDMWITTPSGSRVPFSEIATYKIIRGEVAINHLNGRREIQIFADLKSKKDSPTDILANIKNDIIPEILSKYPSVLVSYEGQNREAQKTKDSLGKVGFIILMLIYVVIAFTFRSYSQPLLLMFMIPFSVIGIVLGHFLHGLPINILSWLGIIALVGIMVNDGLVLVGKFNGFLKDGLKFNDALLQAGISRFRAIFLTSLTTVAGLSPLLLEQSRQAQFLKPMAISISYGIVVATFLTLLMLPLLLSLSNSIKVFFKWLRTGEKVTKEEVERAVIEMK
ncbi:MAG: efflux RND transporter permease subunit [Bacteroidetes bacterium]|jgi:multidrug efflux pump subunit AcrB|nr:efflux RND transporter permease subunit [Bacteroidota bacterium]MBT4969403.1 efflux RND transporter permease subunit [Bacteroidota bacterium]MBT5991065.1 efflux RND transporter permease subunit [Bacteroidota bacterium]MBT6837990.1 efflux RND transporter permease subunit [Bacteroidota bacterium]MBT7039345.1 efflux RND transporter permease subunit [Bacteroidota bacterium]